MHASFGFIVYYAGLAFFPEVLKKYFGPSICSSFPTSLPYQFLEHLTFQKSSNISLNCPYVSTLNTLFSRNALYSSLVITFLLQSKICRVRTKDGFQIYYQRIRGFLPKEALSFPSKLFHHGVRQKLKCQI